MGAALYFSLMSGLTNLACSSLFTVTNIRYWSSEANISSVPHPRHDHLLLRGKTGRLTWGPAESSVYVAAMLKSQTVWFMAVGRDRDQRRCQLLSRQPIPPGSSSLSPRNPTPSQATRTRLENARNSLNTFAHCFARSHPYGM